MSGFMLLIWISLIVILNVRGDGNINENVSFCQHCSSKSLADCSAFESLNHNLTIHCPEAEPKPCVLAIFDGYAGNNETDYMCILSELVDITQNTIDGKKFGNLAESEDSAMTTELPGANASIEVDQPDKEDMPAPSEAEEQLPSADSESVGVAETTEAAREATTTNEIKNSPDIVEPANSESKTVDNADEMPQADQPLTDVAEPAGIEDNKIEVTAAVDEMAAETPQTTQAQTDVEPRMNTVDKEPGAEPKFIVLNCYACKSDAESNCVTKPTKTALCKAAEMGVNGCYTLVQDTHIERGCLGELTKLQRDNCLSPNDAGCEVCHENLCNDEIFSAEPLLCHQCADTLECALEQDANNALPCPQLNDACFLYADEHGKMKRGCESDRQFYQQCQAFGEKRCLTCNGSDGCNSQSFLSEPKLSCSTCDSRSTGKENSKNCAWTQSTASISRCQNYYPYYLEEQCVMNYLPDIELSMRGCSLDIGACEPTYDWCRSCNTSGCNVGNLVTQSCLQCGSELSENCSHNIKELTAENCKAEVQTVETQGCYVIWSMDSNMTSRGCISDLTAGGIDYCRSNKNLCVFCYADGCNNIMSPSSATRETAMAFGLILFGLFYIL